MVEIERNNPGINELPKTVHEEICKLFSEYNNKLKPLIATVESLKQEFPGQILNEIRAFNDHIARCFLFGTTEEDCVKELRKAKGHVSRAILDCYKIILLYYFDFIKDFRQQYDSVNLTLVNDGKFLPELTRLNEEALKCSRIARYSEADSFPEKENSYIGYKKAVLAYDAVNNHILEHSQGLANAQQHATDQSAKKSTSENKRSWKFAFIGAILGVALGVLVTQITNHWDKILSMFSGIIQ